jgi:DNA-binding LytR/AlgR family response regulator
MQRKLKCVLIDDDVVIHEIFQDYLRNNEYAEITDFYQDPLEFLNSGKNPDLVFLDVILPSMNGLSLAFKIKPTPVILFTGNSEYFKDIMNMIHSIDAFPKPIIKERLLESVKKAYTLLNSNRLTEGYAFFHTSEGNVHIQLSAILFVRTVKNSHRNLEVYLKGGRKLIIIGYSIEHIQKIAMFLLRPNRLELVSPNAIDLLESNSIILLRDVCYEGKKIRIELSRVYKKDFLLKLPSL